jgi:hypothetical protein
MHLEDELKQLQHRLALVDLLTERRARPYENMTEFLVVRLGPQWLHVLYGERQFFQLLAIKRLPAVANSPQSGLTSRLSVPLRGPGCRGVGRARRSTRRRIVPA